MSSLQRFHPQLLGRHRLRLRLRGSLLCPGKVELGNLFVLQCGSGSSSFMAGLILGYLASAAGCADLAKHLHGLIVRLGSPGRSIIGHESGRGELLLCFCKPQPHCPRVRLGNFPLLRLLICSRTLLCGSLRRGLLHKLQCYRFSRLTLIDDMFFVHAILCLSACQLCGFGCSCSSICSLLRILPNSLCWLYSFFCGCRLSRLRRSFVLSDYGRLLRRGHGSIVLHSNTKRPLQLFRVRFRGRLGLLGCGNPGRCSRCLLARLLPRFLCSLRLP
mmetsp:Transcript_48410/g.105307  ORF Transcript_48410/g.105307 Transcript_48410/m.105307 type:complete len:274 (+) Transcript_48410:3192-4013(+)